MQRRTFLQGAAAAGALCAARVRLFAAENHTMMNEHPMLTAWTVPPFDKIAVADIKPAILRGHELRRAQHAAIVADKAPPTFANTIAAMDDSDRPYKRAQMIFGIWTTTMNAKPMQKVETDMS